MKLIRRKPLLKVIVCFFQETYQEHATSVRKIFKMIFKVARKFKSYIKAILKHYTVNPYIKLHGIIRKSNLRLNYLTNLVGTETASIEVLYNHIMRKCLQIIY